MDLPLRSRPRTALPPAAGWALAAAGLALGGCCALFACRLGVPAFRDYDEGVYLASARLLLHGRRMFSEVFSSQPPLFLELLRAVFWTFGDTLVAGRGLSAAAAAVACGLTGYLAWTRVEPWAAPWAVALCGGSIVFLREGRAVQAEMPALALALGALAVLAAGRVGLLRALAAGALLGLALATKLLVVPMVLPALALAVERRDGAGPPLRAGAALILAAAATFLAVCAPHGLGTVLQQSVTFQLAGRSAEVAGRFSGPWGAFLVSETYLLAASAAGLALWVAVPGAATGRPGWLVIWTAAAAAFLLLHRPVFAHHLVILVPPLAIAATGALSLRRRSPRRWAVLACGVLAIAALVKREPNGRIRPAPAVWAGELGHAPRPEDEQMVAAVRAFTRPGEVLATDDPMIAFLAGRDVPPALCDSSWKRIATGSLGEGEVVEASRRAAAVLLWTGRLAALPGYTAWLRRNAVRVAPDGAGERGLYVLDPARAAAGRAAAW